ncbi:FTR1 family iron permease [Alicyclobacillus dauci]|uniref:FTR1 family protein n=1 Tax=Alicyclobacillus dauci TaxID=1475485 RepID=A0ABY6Z465_9BACL|nr:FTR1 family protein [Alicyclobacillus dauci]WAH37447.1 FTR1 family protein [Alicyclobacillus dauci]
MFGASLLVALREGLEISLILGIIFSYLRKVNRSDAFKYVWSGSGLALILAAGLGIILYRLTGQQEWAGQVYLEVVVFIFAVAILSYMTFWMKKNSRSMNRGIQSRIDSALNQGGVFQLIFLAFITVIREVLEMIMFLLAVATQGHGAKPVGLGALIGLLISAAIGFAVYRGTSHINLKLFFQVMGNVLIVVGAGLLGNAVHSAIEAGIIKPVAYVYDLSTVLNSNGTLGAILHAFVGYTDHPSIIQAAVWVIYLIISLVMFNRRGTSLRVTR